MKWLVIALVASFMASTARAGPWTHHSDGTICAGSSCDNTAPSAPTISAGDVILIYSIVSANGAARTLSTPAGYTRIDPTTIDSNTIWNEHLFCKVAAGGDTMPTLDWSGSSNTVVQQAVTFSGPTAPDCSTMVHASIVGTNSSGFFFSQTLTITHANTLVLAIGGKISVGTTNYDPIACPSDVNTGRMSSQTLTTDSWPQTAACYRIETTAVSTSSANHFMPADEDNSAQFSLVISLDQQDSAVPTFSVSPSIGTRTTSSIPVTATTACTDCTFYGIEQTAGAAAPTVAQVVAGQDHTGAAAFKSCSAAMTANVQGTCTFSSITDGTVKDGYYALSSTGGGNIAANVSIANQYKIPAFTTPVSVASMNDTAYTTNSKVLDGPGTVYLVACAPGAAAPTVAQVEAQTGGCIRFATSDDATGTMVLTSTDSPAYPDYDLYDVGTYGGQHEASVHSLPGQCLFAPNGYQFVACSVGLTSVAANTLFDLYNTSGIVTLTYSAQTANFTLNGVVVGATSGAYGTVEADSDGGSSGTLTIKTLSGTFSNGETIKDNYGGSATASGAPLAVHTIAVGDIPRIVSTVSPSSAILQALSDGNLSFTASGRQIADSGLVFDVSSATYMPLTLKAVFNNRSPTCIHPQDLVLKTGVAMTAFDVTQICTDADNDTLTCAVVSNNLPTGLAMNATTCHITGTPTVENEGGAIVLILVSDGFGGTALLQLTIHPVTTWKLPDCVAAPTSLSACANAIRALTFSSVFVDTTLANSASVIADNIISQSPAENTEIAPFSTETLTVSLGPVSGPTTVTIPQCIGHSVIDCQVEVFVTAPNASVVLGAGCAAANDHIYSQGPAVGTQVDDTFALTVFCR